MVHFSTNVQGASTRWCAGSIIAARYRLVDRLGTGGMGEVWRAEHLSLGTSVALKLVDIAVRQNPDEILARFQQEARAAARLKSPYVVQILDHGVDGSIAFMVMEMLEGESLEQRLDRCKVLSADEIGKILWEVCRGVDRAHAGGVIHRDLKPSNVFLARQPDGTEVAKVLDFGIAKVLGTQTNMHLQTQPGLVVGTPSYMSPEQVLGRPLDPRSDLWSLAVIACEAITGRRLFEGETLGQIFVRICNAPIAAPSSRATVPPRFDAWFEKGTARAPDDRFQSARELAEELCRALGIAPSPITGSSAALRPSAASTPDTWSHAPLPQRSRRLFTSLVLLGAALAGVGLAYALLSHDERPAGPPDAPTGLGVAVTAATATEGLIEPPQVTPAASASAGVAPPSTALTTPTASAVTGASASGGQVGAPRAAAHPQALPSATSVGRPASTATRSTDPDFGF
jgi:eukaryotic-like serine/threonine-protein kinase